MKKRTPKSPGLSPNDHRLWQRVTKTVSPLRKREAATRLVVDDEVWREWLDANGLQDEAPPPPLKDGRTLGVPAQEPIRQSTGRLNAIRQKTDTQVVGQKPVVEIEKPTHRKLAKGRLPIDATLDLHNLNQEKAHRALLSFLSDSFHHGRRHILVITGKGTSPNSQGILRTMLPIWISTPPLNQFVSGLKQASRDHGGEGAWYIRLKKQKGHAK